MKPKSTSEGWPERFVGRVKKLSHEELVATYQYVSGLFARQQENMSPLLSETAGDMNILKREILNRIQSNIIRNIFKPKKELGEK